ncbi:anthranilate synthase component I family protein [soil metagenome]
MIYNQAPTHKSGLFIFKPMKKTNITTTVKKMMADVYTPVGIYLRLRDRFRDTILLESTDFHAGENSYSFIGINAIGGIEVINYKEAECKVPGKTPEKIKITKDKKITDILWEYMQRFELNEPDNKAAKFAQGLYGYTSYDAIPLFEPAGFTPENKTATAKENDTQPTLPLMRYRLYQYIIAVNHFKDELFICENTIAGIESEADAIESLIKSKDVPVYPFKISGEEASDITDKEYMEIVQHGIESCYRGDVFQIVLSRTFTQKFTGDDFNVYRTLRNINPSPYLFYFDYGDYKLMGSSPESQVIVNGTKAIVHPIAGTFKRTGDDATDKQLAEKLLVDEKENAEHVMLVDLARNDLSRVCDDVTVTAFAKIQYYSHVIHLVSEVVGTLKEKTNPFEVLAATFPAGTLSGAPKIRAMQLINKNEKTNRGYYGGCIGFAGFDGTFNHAILIRSFVSRNNTLTYRAGAGVVAASVPESELQEVNNKLGALKKAILSAEIF